jgi:hypothetical protein
MTVKKIICKVASRNMLSHYNNCSGATAVYEKQGTSRGRRGTWRYTLTAKFTPAKKQ